MRFLKIIISVVLVLKCTHGANILGVFPMDWGSHYILGTKLMKGLAEAGHDVTVVTPREFKNLPKNGSWTDVVMDGYGEEFQKLVNSVDLFDDANKNTFQKMRSYADFLITMSNLTLRHPKVQKLINSNATFDAVIIEQLMNECHHILALRFNCPLIILSSIGPNPMINPKVGNPSPASTIRNINSNSDGSQEMTFIERLKNVFHNIFFHLITNLYMLRRHNTILHEVFPDAPDISNLYYNASLVLLNYHTSLSDAVPLVPNMVEVGGYFIDPPQKLPQDLQEFLDGAKDGAIYFSMGSNLKSRDMPEKKKNAILAVFKKLKQKILWKFEDDLSGKPENVLIKNWIPQQDILAHPNMKLFITHGGLLSTTEAVYHGVPVLAIPVFGDQEMNAEKAVQSGFGLKIRYHDDNFNEETLNKLIQELLNVPKYSENAKMRSRIYHDRPLTPMQSAVFWVEYVIRHKGASHLRVAGIGMPWYKYFMIDVIALLIGGILSLVLIIKLVLRKFVSIFLRKTNKFVKQKTN